MSFQGRIYYFVLKSSSAADPSTGLLLSVYDVDAGRVFFKLYGTGFLNPCFRLKDIPRNFKQRMTMAPMITPITKRGITALSNIGIERKSSITMADILFIIYIPPSGEPDDDFVKIARFGNDRRRQRPFICVLPYLLLVIYRRNALCIAIFQHYRLSIDRQFCLHRLCGATTNQPNLHVTILVCQFQYIRYVQCL